MFTLNNETGQLSAIGQIDAEDSELYNLTVVATDRMPPFNSAFTSVLIIVRDINDNAPQFNASRYLVSINETAEDRTIQQYVTTLGIYDRDREYNNSMLSVTLDSGKFVINPETYRLFTSMNSVLDRETSPTEEFSVIACDQGVPQLCNNATVTVTLLDVNDNDPQFDQSNVTLSIRQLHLVNTLIGVFIAQDQDTGRNAELRYSLQANITEQLFQINPITGSLMNIHPISDEFINGSIELIVTAEDQGVPSRSGSVIVTVMIFEEIGIVPVFNQSVYNVSVLEGRPAGTHVITVLASSTISDIQYFIEVPPEGFTIDPNQVHHTTVLSTCTYDVKCLLSCIG